MKILRFCFSDKTPHPASGVAPLAGELDFLLAASLHIFPGAKR
jgi:hypothetical protein